MNAETVRPVGVGYETPYVLLGSVLILALAITAVGLHQQSHEAQVLDAHQVDARFDLSTTEQNIYADLQVVAEDIQARLGDGETVPSVDELAAKGSPPSIADVTANSCGEHRRSHGETAEHPSYLDISGGPGVVGLFLPLFDPVEVWLKPVATTIDAVPGDARALADTGWYQVASRFDAGATRQHRH